MDPSGVIWSRIQPHRVIASLERLDASTEEHFQQVHAGNTIIDELDHSIHQHPRLHGLISSYFQWGRSLNMVKREVGKNSQLTWSYDVLAVELGRLPAPNRFRESHGGLGTNGEDVFEKSPVRSTP